VPIPASDQQAFYKEVGRRIRDARRRRTPPLTQDGLAELVGLSRTSITNIEQGRQKCLLHTLADIATALRVEAASLISEADGQLKDLNAALKDRPRSEKEWIMSAVTAAHHGSKPHGP
jgi:DNA-binding XRE family transcriptional regulator